MGDCIETKEVKVLIQANGIIRNTKGRFLARLDNEIDFGGEHLIEEHPVKEKMYSRDEMEAKCRESFRAGVKYQLEWGKSTPKTLDTGETIRNVNAPNEDKWIEENH